MNLVIRHAPPLDQRYAPAVGWVALALADHREIVEYFADSWPGEVGTALDRFWRKRAMVGAEVLSAAPEIMAALQEELAAHG